MEFGYAYERTGGNVLEVGDIFNTTLKLTTYTEEEYYFITRTKRGHTSFLIVGPIPIDGSEYIGKYSSVVFKKKDSSSKNVKMEIDNFINDYRKTTQIVEEVELEEVMVKLKTWDLLDYILRDER